MFKNINPNEYSDAELQHRIACLEGLGCPAKRDRAMLELYHTIRRKRGLPRIVPSLAFPGKAKGRFEK